MYRTVWVLTQPQKTHGELIEDVFPKFADDLAVEGCWKLIAAEGPATAPGSLAVEVWTDSITTTERLLDSQAAKAFRAELERIGGSLQTAAGAADEVVTMHISAMRMG